MKITVTVTFSFLTDDKITTYFYKSTDNHNYCRFGENYYVKRTNISEHSLDTILMILYVKNKWEWIFMQLSNQQPEI